ncbi:hypothetical protein Nepgr_019756 [Nepenthes gracilis]|uniref:Uncharacterized protein n=1 Tax=Nepenthes gracilis TaxID=150966 RepID=A0AAD3SU32_NEPGR|nr:hypothetical protein Nepgr_019756 [Nepenthes gracilis]
MASAVLASQNDSNWPQARAGFMGKIPFLNPNSNNPNPLSPNSISFPRRQQIHAAVGQITHQNVDEFTNPTASDDASSFNRRPEDFDSRRMEGGSGFSHYVSFHISTFSRSDLRSLKSRLMEELEQVRCLTNRIDAGEFHVRNVSKSFPSKVKKLSGKKRAMPFSAGDELKRLASSSPSAAQAPESESVAASVQLMKMCTQILGKLMKQKFCWIFNEPVDAASLGLTDYHQIVKHPMDLGTVKSKLSRKLYPSPDEFAADVRLTFNNALLYNPKGQHVHHCAEQYLGKFEQMFQPIYRRFKIEKQRRLKLQNWQQEKQHWQEESQNQRHWCLEKRDKLYHREEKHKCETKQDVGEAAVVEELQGNLRSRMPSQGRPKKTASSKKLDRVEPRLEPAPVDPVPPPPVETVPPVANAPVVWPAIGKLPKPRAKDPDKRQMSMEEKQKLGLGLQSLPDEKMAQVVQIIGKRNGHLTQDGDEIELDIEAVDTETLWELDRFVTNYKKMVSKIKRQALINNVVQIDSNHLVGDVSLGLGKGKKGEVGEEDVDIGDEMPISHFPSVEIERDDDGHAAAAAATAAASGSSSSSSSSTSDSSSSSDSDSATSDSDLDDAQSRDNESKNFHNT